ncbi:c-type cytochrome [Sphingobium sp. KCTC 72723]|nr:cytochrome c [Sphingobium sp. KCTC 72723]
MLLEQAGRPVASLIGRDDLELEYLRAIVRQGLIEMPPFRPTELSDAEIDEIYAHIMSAKPPVTTPAKPVKKGS